VKLTQNEKTKNRTIIFTLLLCFQLTIFLATVAQAKTPFLWIWSIASFIPAVIVCIFYNERKYVLASLIILFVSQQAVFIFVNSGWGFTYGSDQINDFQTAELISENAHFQLGQLGYSSRLSYSYYPMLHIFSAVFEHISGLQLTTIAVYLVPILNALFVTMVLYHLNRDLFGLEGRTLNIATLLFQVSFYYTSFDSQFVRESFAFPLVLFSLWIAARMASSQFRKDGSRYAAIAAISFIVIVLSHQISSYVMLAILAIMALGLAVFHRNSRLILPLLLMGTVLGAYTLFVTADFTVTEGKLAIEGLLAIFQREGSPTIQRLGDPLTRDLAYTQYVIIGMLLVIGGLLLLRRKKKNWMVNTLLSFFVLAFVLCLVLRLSTPADPWSFTYYMSLRGTIWAFLGISVLAAFGLAYVFRLNRVSRKGFVVLTIIICILAVGKFAQYGPIVTGSSDLPLTYDRYVSSQWLKLCSVHGSIILVAPSNESDAFEGSRSIAPYAYLKEYFLDEERGRTYAKFYGYIPFIDAYFEQYKNLTGVNTMYCNGNTSIGMNFP
jgi:LPXTG-motif cell wall-anchored protein